MAIRSFQGECTTRTISGLLNLTSCALHQHDVQCDSHLLTSILVLFALAFFTLSSTIKAHINKRGIGNLTVVILFISTVPVALAGRDEDNQPTSPRCPIFEGVTASFTAWLISFTAWIAWKAPELFSTRSQQETQAQASSWVRRHECASQGKGKEEVGLAEHAALRGNCLACRPTNSVFATCPGQWRWQRCHKSP